MKHWQEMGDIVDRVLRFGNGGATTALAIVTRIEGSAYRRPGAKLLIDDKGGVLGGVSGGCLEEDVRLVGLKVIESGRTRTLHYDTGGDDSKLWGLGLGCEGRVSILVSPIRPDSATHTWAPIRRELQGDAPFALATIVEDQGEGGVLVVGRSGRMAGSVGDPSVDKEVERVASAALDAGQTKLSTLGSRQIFTEVLLPPPKLLVCGAGDDARPLVDFATAVGFRVFVADHRPAHLTAERFPAAQKLLQLRPDESSPDLPTDGATFVVVKTHALTHDTAWVKRLLGTSVPYIGVLGPRARIRKILDGAAGSQERIFGPVGIDIGADGPEQVALSIVAEALAIWSKRTPRHLREIEGALHASA